MRVLVLGGGVVGVTSAWYLAADGHEVTVVDRQPGPALETSFANGGQISASYAEPWANPGAPLKILKWLARDDAPLLFRPRFDARQWRWGLQFLIECLPSRTRHNTIQCLNLALYSRDCLQALRAETGIRYDHLERGILQFYTEPDEFERGVDAAALMREYGCDRDVKTPDECVAIEPALAQCRDQLAGGIFTATDESGDAQRFTAELSRMAAERGVTFAWDTEIQAVVPKGDSIAGVRVVHGGRFETRAADAYVMALGSYSPFLLAPLHVPCNVYPAKGYSATIDIGEHRGAPTVSLGRKGNCCETFRMRSSSATNSISPVPMFLLMVCASRFFTVPVTATTYSLRRVSALAWTSLLEASKTTWVTPVRSRTSIKINWPRSRRLFTHPMMVAREPASVARRAPHIWERCKSPRKSSTDDSFGNI